MQDHCNALVLSGGSNNGAWEVGVLWGLAHYGEPSNFYWDVVSGISAGSINTAGTAGWRPDEVVEMTEFLSDTWRALNTSDLWQFYPHEVKAALEGPSLLDSSPGLKTG